MGSHGSGQQSHLQPPLARQNSWFSLTLDEVENQLGNLGKPLGSMNLDELLKNVCTAEANTGLDISNSSPAAALQRQASLTLARAFSGKTVDEVWRAIQLGQKMKSLEDIDSQSTLGETTLEDFLVKAGLFVADASLAPEMVLDSTLTAQNFTPQIGLSPTVSLDALSDSPLPGRKRNSADAYHNELVTKVSRLEEENIKLKKEKELEKMLPLDSSSEPRYQLRRTSSF
ncbi:unnamed protein product [Coffea canephora]|uniref:ABSCISIC ACID-INSENSITIVE 5-like protein 2 n=1 Tax=Coffea canephora TaxID=49390 RepID=A0A068UMG0_COFCA|nr:unnamed protein product [Coffea canephora]